MNPTLESIFNILVDRPIQEWVGGLMLALLLALALAGAYMACRRWIKPEDEMTPLIGLGVIVIFASMIFASVSSEMKFRRPQAADDAEDGRPSGVPGRGPGPGFGSGFGRGGGFTTRMTDQIFENADTDHDGRLTPDEAASAAGTFIEKAEEEGGAPLDHDALLTLIRERLRLPGFPGPPPPPTTSEPERTAQPPSETDPAAQPQSGTPPQ